MNKTNQFSNYRVEQLEYKVARGFIILHHYAHTFPASCVRLGAYDPSGELIGVIVYGMPCQPKLAQSIVPLLNQGDIYELQRLFVKDCTPKNFESWFISRTIDWLKENKTQIKMLVSFADPHQGHLGTVYQATNWLFAGRSSAITVYLAIDGIVVHARTLSKGKVDKSLLMKEKRRGKYRYVMFLAKTIDVYYNIITSEYIRTNELDKWLYKEQEDNAIYLERKNGFLRKHKIDLIKNMKRPILPYPKK
jgi:hypothetical protein